MSVSSDMPPRASKEEMDELKAVLKSCSLDFRPFCEYLAEELAEPGHEEESKSETYRGWFKKGRFPDRALFEKMWELLHQHDLFRSSQLVKPQYVSGIVDKDLEAALVALSKRVTDHMK